MFFFLFYKFLFDFENSRNEFWFVDDLHMKFILEFFLLWASEKAISVEFRLTYTEQDTYAWLLIVSIHVLINMYLVSFNWIYKKHSLNEFHEKCCQCFISLCAAQRYIYNDIFENFLIAFISST